MTNEIYLLIEKIWYGADVAVVSQTHIPKYQVAC